MKFLSDKIDRFCYRHPRFGISNLMTILVVCTIVVYVMDLFSSSTLSAMLCFSTRYILRGQVWRLLTFIICPGSSNIIGFVISMYFYWFIGSNLEREWGSGKFTIYYFSGVILTALCGLIFGYATISYVNLSLFLCFATLYPNLQFLLFFFIPIKAKWLAWVDVALLVLNVIQYVRYGIWGYVALIGVSLLTYLIFFWSELMYYLHRGQRRTSRQTVNFKKATKTKQENKGYMHKCAVCGRTDTDYPNLEFRYCSKCVGYYCYCMDHINNHVHITQ